MRSPQEMQVQRFGRRPDITAGTPQRPEPPRKPNQKDPPPAPEEKSPERVVNPLRDTPSDPNKK